MASSRLFAEHTADIWYERTAAELTAARRRMRQVRRHRIQQGNRHSGRLVRFRLQPPGRAHSDESACPGRPTCIIEGGDQYRGWFHSSLLIGVGLKGASPYRACALNGWVLDGEGRAMHKSLGNAIEPEEIIKQHGAELLRLWSASVEFNEDVRVSETILDAAGRSLSQAAQHVPLLARQPARFRSRAPMPCRRMKCWRSTSGFWCAPKTWCSNCRAWYDEFAFHKVYRARLRFRHRGSERASISTC